MTEPSQARRVALGAVINFRDLGGYATGTGGTTCWGAVYRSDSLHKVTPAETRELAKLGIKTVLDLRSAEERVLKPSLDGSRHHPLTSRPPTAGTASLRTRDDGEAWLADEYLYMLKHAALDIGSLFRWLAVAEHRPAVFHCAGGKDRTGLSAALLLTLLGVDRQTVLDDYELTSHYVSRADLADVVVTFCSSGMSVAAAEGLLSTPRWALAAALDQLDGTYGGVEQYLLRDAGMSEEELSLLRRELVEEP